MLSDVRRARALAAGRTRSGSAVLYTCSERPDCSATAQVLKQNLHAVKRIGVQTREALEAGDLARFADLMNVHWENKRRRSAGMSNPAIDRWQAVHDHYAALHPGGQ